LPDHAPSPSLQDEEVLFALEVVAPARRMIQRSARNSRHLRSSPYTSRNPKIIYPSSPSSSKGYTHSFHSFNVPSSPVPFKQPKYSGDWEDDAIAASKRLYASANSLIVMDDPAIFPPALLPVHTKPVNDTLQFSPPPVKGASHDNSRPSSRLCTPGKSSSPSVPEGSPIVPVSRKRTKLLRDKDGKPMLACHFCRGRKIACGPPPTGSDDPTCK
ncbi:hypothetical protein H0H87_005059, partial [Tephrocybe sp. NHM501043]